MRAIATVTHTILDNDRITPLIELVEDKEIIGKSDEELNILIVNGMAKEYDDTKPLPPRGHGNYEPGKTYPANRFIYNNGKVYESNCETSTTFILTEWDERIY